MNSYDIIKKPILSEKAVDGVKNKVYVFAVDFRADKTQIKAAVEEAFKVKVAKVNTMNVRGKYKTQGRTGGYTSKFKKAIVSLKEGEKPIPFFESLA